MKSAFTLIELLVIIAIVAILASLLLPAVARAKAAVHTTECRNNLRDLGLAFRMHLDEWEAYPATANGAFLLQEPSSGVLVYDDWKQALAPHIGANLTGSSTSVALRKMRCPQILLADGGKRAHVQYGYNASGTAPLNHPANLGLGGHIDNEAQSQIYRATRESAVRMPSSMIAAGDIAMRSIGTLLWSSGHYSPLSTNHWLWPAKAHNGQANMLFCDGHVESSRPTNWLSASDSARRQWNNDYELHPETWAKPN
jgi:prepilin-type processing-associated H-X9-DG protein/prepilin-type N-terminal cleavage/methylation domain-containing protein